MYVILTLLMVKGAGIAHFVEQWAGWVAGFDSWQRQEIFIFSTASRLTFWTHPFTYPMGTGDTVPRVKWPECEVDHSSPSNFETKNGGAIHPIPHASSWCGA
jgi:hypothetical protein